MPYVDSHAHLTSNELFPQIESLLDRAQKADIKKIINICTDLETLARGIELQKQFPWVYQTAATTPHDAHTLGDEHFESIAKAARSGQLVAIGETGLEYFHYPETKEVQKKLFIRYLHLAKECQLPVVIHCRDAFEDFFSLIDQEYKEGQKWLPGVLHCFTGTIEEARELVKRDWFISFSGIITFKKSDLLREVVKTVPIDNILIETDSPYLAPQKHRGKQNEPAFVVETAQLIADLKDVSLNEVQEKTWANVVKLFKI